MNLFLIDRELLKTEDAFRIERILGNNAMETTQLVYLRCEDGSERGPYVRKIVNKTLGLGSAYLELFEAQTSSGRKPVLPVIYQLFEADDQLFILMEYVDGQPMSELLRGCQYYTERLAFAARYFPALCKAVDALHSSFKSPVIHRDLKPSNIIITSDGIKLIDFGVARIYKKHADRDTQHFGTRPYASPEQYGFSQTDVRSDVYSLGMILYECLAGEEPQPNIHQSLDRHPEIGEELKSIILGATQLDPCTRIQSAEDLFDAFMSVRARFAPMMKGSSKASGSSFNIQEYPDFSEPQYQLAYGGNGVDEQHLGESISAEKSKEFKGFKIIGIIWDIILLINAILLIIAAWSTHSEPTTNTHENLSLTQFIVFFIWFSINTLIVCYLLSDRRPIRKIFPQLPCLPIKKELSIGVIAMIATTVICVVAAALLP